MSAYVVFIDSEHAKLFKLTPEQVVTTTLKSHERAHTSCADPLHHKNEEKFFHAVAGRLADASEVLLVGPGLGKTHFKSHLERHHHTNLAKRIVGVETVDHPTDNEILARARKFFRVSDMYR